MCLDTEFLNNTLDTFDEVVRELMPMPLNHPIDGPIRQVIDQLTDLVPFDPTGRLLCIFGPDAILVADRAVVAHMSQHQDSMCSLFLELLALVDDDVLVGQELVVGEEVVLEGVGGGGSVDGAQADDADLYATGEAVDVGDFLLGEELSLASF